MEIFNLNNFLESGIFITSPIENKIWCVYDSITKHSDSENLEYPYFYFNDFYFSRQKCFYKGKKFFEFTTKYFLEIISDYNDNSPKINWDCFLQDNYENQFRYIKNLISDSSINKGVPFSSLIGKAEINNENKIYLLKNLINKSLNYNTYVYGFWDEKEGFIGATPELVFKQNKKLVHTIALAGTIKNDKNVNKEVFSKDPKILNEHNYVIEGINKSLASFGHLKMSPTMVFELPHLLHLKTDIILHLFSQFEFLSLLKCLHPTPAVGIYPSNSQFWQEEQKLNSKYRKLFAAPFGVLLNKNDSLCVCLIRGMQWNRTDIQITAGGGVVKESDFLNELDEILSKINSIIKNLGLSHEF